MLNIRRESDAPSGRGTWGLDYDWRQLVRPTIPGTIGIKAELNTYGGYTYDLPEEKITEAISPSPPCTT